MFLLCYYKYSGNEQALEMVEKTMAGMTNGGLYDHIGSGFARYSTDETWLVPHFEKMLYDNARLLYVITECWQVTKKDRYKILAEELTAFIEREMTNEHGAFLSAIDADSEGVEGKYYVWSKEEVIDLLGEKEGELFCTVYDVTDKGNFEGKNIPNLIHSQKEKWAVHFGLSFKEINDVLNHCRNILFEARQKRIYPHVDDKMLTTWNGLIIAALAKAGAVFNRPEYIERAQKAANFIETNLWKEGLQTRWRDGEAKFPGYLDDYSAMVWAYIELYEANGSDNSLHQAVKLKDELFARFESEEGGFYFTDQHGETLIVREKKVYDGALPSGNSIASSQLWRLAKLTKDDELLQKCKDIVSHFSSAINEQPIGVLYMMQMVMVLYKGGREIAVSGNGNEDFLKNLQTNFYPFDVWTDNPFL
jgi:uncharacterized protein YyaL (SSP411 family)